DRVIWERVVRMIRSQEMPPGNRPQPTPEERQLLTTWTDAELAKVDCTGRQDPGRVTIRRLNRAEYNNTIRDLVGVPFQPAEDFQAASALLPQGGSQTDCARKILERFASRAFRRPVGEEELNRLVRLVALAEKEGDRFEVGIQLAVQAILVSPHFLFRIEQDR